MPRKWRVDGDDDDRLPEGVKRTGYDADTQTYTYESVRGEQYQGRAGERYGELTRTGTAAAAPRAQSSAVPQPTALPSAPPQPSTPVRPPNYYPPNASLRATPPRVGRALSTPISGAAVTRRAVPSTPSSTTSHTPSSTASRAPTSTTSHTPTSTPSSSPPEVAPRTHTYNREHTFSVIMGSNGVPSAPYPRRMETIPSRAPASRAQTLAERPRPTMSAAPSATRELYGEVKGYAKERARALVRRVIGSIRRKRMALQAKRERTEMEEEARRQGWI